MESLKRRKVLEMIAATFGASLLASCGGSDSGPTSSAPPPPPPCPDAWMVYANPCDPRVLALLLGTGQRFSLLGCKTASGTIQSAHELLFTDTAGNSSTVEFVPEENKLIGTAGNVQLSIRRPAGGGWGIGLLAGAEQLELNLSDIDIGGIPPAPIAPWGDPASARAGRHLGFDIQGQNCGACAALLAPAASADAALVQIDVSGCAGTSPEAFIQLRDESGKLLDTTKATAAGDNCFNAAVGDSMISDAAVMAAAKKAQDFVGAFNIVEADFTSILAKLKSTSLDVLREEIVNYLKSQNKFADTFQQFADYLGAAGPGMTDAQKTASFKVFLGKALRSIFAAVDFYDCLRLALQTGLSVNDWTDAYSQYRDKRLQLQAMVNNQNGKQFTGAVSGPIPAAGPYPLLSVTTGETASVSRLRLDPAIPAAGQPYCITGTIACLVSGDRISITIAGADGYTDSTFALANGHGNQTFSVAVPCAGSAVHDVVTMTVQRGGVQIAGRTASLVFG